MFCFLDQGNFYVLGQDNLYVLDQGYSCILGQGNFCILDQGNSCILGQGNSRPRGQRSISAVPLARSDPEVVEPPTTVDLLQHPAWFVCSVRLLLLLLLTHC